MKIVVLDTATLVTGLGWLRAPGRTVVNAALAGRFVPATSPELLAELEATLAREELAEAFPDPGRIASLVERMSIVVESRPAPRVVADPDANRLLGVAEAAVADFLVTTDISLINVGSHGETRIVRPT